MKSVRTPQYSAFLTLIIEARKNANFTQLELATELGKPQSYVSKYESGERRLDIIELISIANVIKLDLHGLVDQLTKVTSQ